MNKQLEELAQPVAWRYRYTKPGITDSHGEPWVGDWKFVADEANCNPAPNYQKCALYSQECVNALIAEHKASQDALKNVTELWNEQRQRIAELERYAKERDAENESLALTVGKLRAKLATPVRLPDVLFISVSRSPVAVMHAERVKERIRAAGFTVEGDA